MDWQNVREWLVAFGPVLTGLIALAAIIYSNRIFAAEQRPHVFAYSALNFPDRDAIQIKNIGKGIALDIELSNLADHHVDLTQDTQPKTINLAPHGNDPQTIMIKGGLLKPDASGVMTVYISYRDALERKYRTISMFKQVGSSYPCIGNKVERTA